MMAFDWPMSDRLELAPPALTFLMTGRAGKMLTVFVVALGCCLADITTIQPGVKILNTIAESVRNLCELPKDCSFHVHSCMQDPFMNLKINFRYEPPWLILCGATTPFPARQGL